MSQVIKIIKENILKIPVGTILHFHSFYNKQKDDGSNLWDSINYYIWQTPARELKTVYENQIYPDLKDYYVNCIVLSWKRKFLYEGDEYWKVFIDKEITPFHKLEFKDGKHHPAELFKPYKDIVYSNTRFMTNDCQRFETKEEAEQYCYKLKNKISVHESLIK